MGLAIDDIDGAGARLTREFFTRSPDEVAFDLVGSLMRLRDATGAVVVQIVEAEAYGGEEDAASHAFSGPTERCRVMFGPPGHLYVYRIYGVHWCVNVVTGDDGSASAVLLRAAALRHSSRRVDVGRPPDRSMRGPGKLTRTLSITGDDNGVDCCSPTSQRVSFHADSPLNPGLEVSTSARVGVTRNVLRQSRYFAVGHRDVSRFVAARPRE